MVVKILVLPVVLLALTVPWWFAGGGGVLVFGLPAWAVYAVGASIVYALVISWQLRRGWKSENGENPDDRTG